jgi:hypothetical protein
VSDEERRERLIEALRIGASIFDAAAAAEVTMQEFNGWLRADVSWGGLVREAEEVGRIHKSRLEKMRELVERHDAAMELIQERVTMFKAFKTRQARGAQMDLM